MEADPDRALVEALQGDDAEAKERALGDLFDAHYERVVLVAYRVTRGWSDAEDVAQEVFLGVARGLQGFRGTASLRSWLYRVTVNRAIDHLRRRARRPAVRLPSADVGQQPRDEFGASPSATPDPMVQAAAHDKAAAVREALEVLSPKLRAVLVLRYFEGLSYEELAEVLDCSMGTVKSRLFRAHSTFSEILTRRGISLDLEDPEATS
jgi:RNA polymerase sigma-70 factor (ECF subfamily)